MSILRESPVEKVVASYLKLHPRRSNREYQLFANKALQIVKAKLGAANDGIITRRDNALTFYLKNVIAIDNNPSRFSSRSWQRVKQMLQRYLNVTVDPIV